MSEAGSAVDAVAAEKKRKFRIQGKLINQLN